MTSVWNDFFAWAVAFCLSKKPCNQEKYFFYNYQYVERAFK